MKRISSRRALKYSNDFDVESMSCAWSFYSLVQIVPKALHSD